MSIVTAVAKLRLFYHSNMLDVVNAANQLKLIGDDAADMANKNHLKECFDCLDRLGYKLPEEVIKFKNAKS